MLCGCEEGRHGSFHYWMHERVAGKTVKQVKLDPSLALAIPARFRGEFSEYNALIDGSEPISKLLYNVLLPTKR